jgi:hypothetical protein
MRINWLVLIAKLTFWLSTEIILGLVGLDDLADCGEYVLSVDSPSIACSYDCPVKHSPFDLSLQVNSGGI